jgi:hypothetical protein
VRGGAAKHEMEMLAISEGTKTTGGGRPCFLVRWGLSTSTIVANTCNALWAKCQLAWFA